MGLNQKLGLPKGPAGTVCYGDINLFLLRNPDNPERDILMTEVGVTLRKGCAR